MPSAERFAVHRADEFAKPLHRAECCAVVCAKWVVEKNDTYAENRAEVFAERHAVPRAELCAENRLVESLRPVDVTCCINSVQIWLDKVQECAYAQSFAEH